MFYASYNLALYLDVELIMILVNLRKQWNAISEPPCKDKMLMINVHDSKAIMCGTCIKNISKDQLI